MKRRILLTMVCAVMALSLCGCAGRDAAPHYPRALVRISTNTTGDGVYLREDGTQIKVQMGQAEEPIVYATPSRAHFVSSTERSILLSDANGNLEATVLEGQQCSLVNIYDDSLLYWKADENGPSVCRYEYASKKHTLLGDAGESSLASGQNDSSLLLALSDGTLWAFGPDGSSRQLKLQAEGKVVPLAISSDGSMGVWAQDGKIFYANGREVGQFETAAENATDAKAFFDPSARLLAIANADACELLVKQAGKPAQIFRFEQFNRKSFVVSTAQGNILQTKEGEGRGFYVCGIDKENDQQRILYYAAPGSKKREVMRFGLACSIQNGKIFYLSGGQSHILYSASLKGGKVLGQYEIDDAVEAIMPSADGSLVCYGKDLDERGIGDLYCAKWGETGRLRDKNVYLGATAVELEGDSFVYIKAPYTVSSEEGERVLGRLMWANPAGDKRMLAKHCVSIEEEYTFRNAGLRAYKKDGLKFLTYAGFQQRGALVCHYHYLNDQLEVITAKGQVLF